VLLSRLVNPNVVINFKDAAGGIIYSNSSRETNCTPSNLWSQDFGSRASLVFMFIVVYSAVGFTGMDNSKVASESKASDV